MNTRTPWNGYAILGNGELTAVYSDDARITAKTHQKGIQHFYFADYTADYVASTSFDLLGDNSAPVESVGPEEIGMKNFFTTRTQASLKGGSKAILCFIHPEGAAVLSLTAHSGDLKLRYLFRTVLRDQIKTDQDIQMTSLRKEGGVAVAVWSNGTALAIAPLAQGDKISISKATVSISGVLGAEPVHVLLVPSSSVEGAIAKVRTLQRSKDIESSAEAYWNSWMNRGVLPSKLGVGPEAVEYMEAYKRNLYCVKSATLNGMIPADITGQFVTNNMPQLYPRDAMMCARVLLLTGHVQEAKQIIDFWARPEVPMKTPGEWYARYDAHGKAVNAGSGARFDEPEWDANGYYIYLLHQFHEKTGVWPVDRRFVYKIADFLASHLSSNGLLWEGGIVEWTGYLPATNMIDAAGLLTAAKMAEGFGDTEQAKRYRAAMKKISDAMPEMFDESRQTYADVRFTEQKENGGVSSNAQSGSKTYLWDTTANVGVIWGYPNHRELKLSNEFYDQNTVKLGGGMQYFDSPDPGLASYGHGVFFFTTAAAAEYQSMYGDKSKAKGFIDWMMRNANSYGLMPEHISPDGKECSPASPLSWCCAEFAAALLLWSKS